MMLYVKRDATGNITSLCSEPEPASVKVPVELLTGFEPVTLENALDVFRQTEHLKLYAKRNQQGEMVEVSTEHRGDNEPINNDEVRDIFKRIYPDALKSQVTHELKDSDTQMIRVLEDLIELLIEKNIINLTELPRAAQQKIFNRKKIRQLLSDAMMSDDKIQF